MLLARGLGMEVHLEQTLGTLLIAPGAAAWVVGLGMHLVVSGLIALVYAWGFEHVTHRAGWTVGLAFSLVHTLVSGVSMGALLPGLHPLVTEAMPGPGYFMLNLGALGAAAFVVLHALYGAIVGALYGPVLHPGAARTTP